MTSEAGLAGIAARRKRRWSPVPPAYVGAVLALPTLALLALFVVYPLGKLVADSFSEGGLENYDYILHSAATRRAFIATFRDGAIVTLLAVVAGSLIAWRLRTTHSRTVQIVLWGATLVPLWMGVVVKNYAFTIALSTKGIVNTVITEVGIVDRPVRLLYTEFAVIVGIWYSMVPYAVLSLYAVFRTIDLDLLRAAESLGATRSRAFLSVAVPLAAPGIVASTAIVFVLAIGFYVTPILLGGPQTSFVASVIQDDIFRVFNYPRAAATGSVLLAAALLVVVVVLKLVGRERLMAAVR